VSRGGQEEVPKEKKKQKAVWMQRDPDRFLLVVFGIGTAFQTHA